MIKVHHLDHSRSLRVLWMLEELGLPYQVVNYQRDPKTWLAPQALRDVHPLGKSPVLQDDALVLAESGAILWYLGEGTGFVPTDPVARAQMLGWMFWEQYSHEPVIAIRAALLTPDPAAKVMAARKVARDWRLGRLGLTFDQLMPNRPARPVAPELLPPNRMPKSPS